MCYFNEQSASLIKIRIFASSNSLIDTKQFVINSINEIDGLEVEYYEIVNGNTLQPIEKWEDSEYIVGCITVHCGRVRLIDNIKYK